MKSGSPILFDIALFDPSYTGLSYANYAAFTAAGWTLTFIDMATGIAVTPTLTATMTPVAGVSGRHSVQVTLTTASWTVRITPPTVFHAFTVLPTATWTGEQYDTDSIYSRLNSVFGVVSATSVPGATLNQLVEGDSYSCTVTIPASYLTARVGWTDLSGTVLDGTIRSPSDDGTGTVRATLTEGTYLTHNANLLAFDIAWSTFPSGMVLTTPERTAGSVNFRVEVQAKKAGKVLTILYNAPMLCYRQDDAT
jgi:hypothetical protein